jgi:O-antigen ligase
LVVLTELNPQRAFVALMKRCAFVFVPFSILFIKYYPQWGRGFDGWSGLPSNTGVTTNKNILGCGCFIFGFFFVWHILQHWSQRREEAARREVIVSGVLLLATLWLMYLAHSSTALGTFVMAVGMLLFSGLRFVTSRNIGKIVITGALTFFVANSALGLVDQAIALLGRDPTLTDRTKIWREVLKFDINPVLGTGFEDFWNEPRRAVMRQIFFWEPNQAHNGYLETYLCLGLIGLAFMFFLLLTAFFRSARRLEINRPLAQYGLGFIAGYAVYNWTEAAFKALHPMWFVFFLVLMEFPPMAGVAEVSGEPDLPAAGEAKRT